MHISREYWAIVSLAATLVGGGVVLARPILIAGATMIGAWLLARQYAFVQALADVNNGLSLTQELAHDRVVAEQPTPLTILVICDESLPLELTIKPGLPAAATTHGELGLSLEPGRHRAEGVVDISWPIAGTFRFDPPTILARDPSGMFEGRLVRGPTPAVTVDPRGPQNVHIGKGGEYIRRVFGEYKTHPLEAGLEPAEIREYVPGDAARLIDWKSTARMGSPHVREFESETDQQTVCLIDHRGTMADGDDRQTKLDYARHWALSLVEEAQKNANPLGLYAVDDDGVSVQLPPKEAGNHYATVRSHLHTLASTPDGGPVHEERNRWSASRTRRIAALAGDSTFTTRLQPYAETTAKRQEVDNDPLLAVVRTHIDRLQGKTWTVIISDDTHRAELREAALFARRGGDQVLLVLTPTVLFESGGFADLAAAHDHYREFETFRQSLDRLDRISAVELAPGDRLSTVLSAGQRAQGTAA